MKRVLLAMSTLLGACGPSYECKTSWGSFSSEVPVYCDKVQIAFDGIRDFMTIDGTEALKEAQPVSDTALWARLDQQYPLYSRAVMSRKEFDKFAKSIDVKVLSDVMYKGSMKNEGWGEFGSFSGIKTCRGCLWVTQHELLHMYELSKGISNTSEHLGWKTKGYSDKTEGFYTWFRAKLDGNAASYVQ